MAKPEEIPSLTGVRGLAAVAIMAYHLAYSDAPLHVSYRVLPGYLAVDLFFLLSGFVMALTYSARFRRAPGLHTYRLFLQRRFARIYPVYLLLTVGFFTCSRLHLVHTAFSFKTLLSNIFLLQQTGIGLFSPVLGTNILHAAWSISTEVVAYFLFPLLIGVTLFRSWLLAGATAILCVGSLIVVALFPGYRGPLDLLDSHRVLPLVRCLAEFTFGLITWRVWPHLRFRASLTRFLDLALPVALAVLCSIPSTDLLIVALFPVLILQICSPSSLLGLALGSRAAVRLGDYSYSLYLIQIPSRLLVPGLQTHLARAGTPDPHLLARLLVGGFDILAAGLLFHTVEKPARTRLRLWMEPGRTPPAELEPAAP
jgi:peptidoglycan/LPS O-acetylase OafA/YrhL